MRQVLIDRIFLDAGGRLRVRPRPPEAPNYAFIYRDASSVRWDAADRVLYMLPVEEFTPAQEFTRILSAVQREYGHPLVIDSSTTLDVPGELPANGELKKTPVRKHDHARAPGGPPKNPRNIPPHTPENPACCANITTASQHHR